MNVGMPGSRRSGAIGARNPGSRSRLSVIHSWRKDLAQAHGSHATWWTEGAFGRTLLPLVQVEGATAEVRKEESLSLSARIRPKPNWPWGVCAAGGRTLMVSRLTAMSEKQGTSPSLTRNAAGSQLLFDEGLMGSIRAVNRACTAGGSASPADFSAMSNCRESRAIWQSEDFS